MLPHYPLTANDHSLLENGSFKNPASARAKVAQDIAFLQDKILAMKAQAKPNQLLIDHYSAMLKSRLSVLSWLLDSSDQTNSQTSDQRSA